MAPERRGLVEQPALQKKKQEEPEYESESQTESEEMEGEQEEEEEQQTDEGEEEKEDVGNDLEKTEKVEEDEDEGNKTQQTQEPEKDKESGSPVPSSLDQNGRDVGGKEDGNLPDADRRTRTGKVTLGLASDAVTNELGARRKKPKRAALDGDREDKGKRKRVERNGGDDEGIFEGNLVEKYPNLMEGIEGIRVPVDTKEFLKKRLKRVGKNNLEQMEEKWAEIKASNVELCLKWNAMVREQVKMALHYV